MLNVLGQINLQYNTTENFFYFRVETANHPFVRAADEYLQSLEAVDAALIFETQTQLDQVWF
jgi:hypothetical protein